MPTIYVIGSNCFTGSHIVDALLDEPDVKVVGISRSVQPKAMYLPYALRPAQELAQRFEFHAIDLVKDFDRLRDLLDRDKPATVIHVAALSEVALSNHRPIEYYQTNTLGVVRLCDYLRQAGWLERYLHISSAEIFGPCEGAVDEKRLFNPSTPYAVSKAAADMHLATLIQHFRFPATLIRSTNVYGRHQQLFKIIPRMAIYLKLGRTLELHGGGRSVKNFIHVRDVVRGLKLAWKKGATGTYHFSVNSNDTVADVVRRVCELMGQSFEKNVKVVGERLGQDSRYWLDCSKAKNELGWQPTEDFDAGVRETIRWVEDNWETIGREPLDYVHRV